VAAEPRGTGEAFDAAIAGHYAAIAAGRGALLLAVYRGKASEGIDFADAAARGVLIVGIPFPSRVDVKARADRRQAHARACCGRSPGAPSLRWRRALNLPLSSSETPTPTAHRSA